MYAELLGLYLGDGHITQMARADRLRLFLDAKYPNIVDESEALLRRCFPENRVGRVVAEEGRMVVLWAYSLHLTCLFPQHGAGKKHDRPVVLEPWQNALVDAAPWAFLRGCIRSDGCVFVNRTGRYEYLSYDFSNLSQDILDLFVATCAASVCGLAVTRGTSGSTGGATSPRSSNTSVSRPEATRYHPRRSAAVAERQTRGVQVAVGVYPVEVRVLSAASLRYPERRVPAAIV